jgi:hypothetical protein
MGYDFSAYSITQLRNIIIVNDRTIRESTEVYDKMIAMGIDEGIARVYMPPSSLWEWTDQAEQELKRREAAHEPSNAV